jgi:hypothetical protein
MEFLYVIVPFFNFFNSKNLSLNLNFFVSNLKKHKNIRIVLVEGVYENNNQLKDFSDDVYKHIKVNLPDILWVKENLINIGFDSVSDEWQYGCWIDRDVAFANPFWVGNTIEKLKNCDVLQPWVECTYLDENFQTQNIKDFIKQDKVLSYCYSSISEKKLFKDNIDPEEYNNILLPDIFKHSGQAWCINRNFYDKLGKLYDKAILGAFDGFLCHFLENNKNIFYHFKDIVDPEMDYQISKLKNAKIDYVNGMILHHYHGTLSSRGYIDRYSIFNNKNKLNVNLHLTYDENNVLKFTEEGKKFKNIIKNYFLSRKEY